MKVSEEATRMVYIISKPYTAKWIRSLAKFYLNHKSFSVSYCGKHQKYNDLLMMKMLHWVYDNGYDKNQA